MSLLMLATSGGSAALPAPVTPMTWDSTVNLHVDGNSIYANFLVSSMDAYLWELAPFATSGASHSHSAIPGQSWLDMANNPAEADSAWVAGKTNVLLLSETTNSVFNEGKTQAQVLQTATQYIAARRALHPWKILLAGTIPRGGDVLDAANNATLSSIDAYMAANYKDMGADGYVGFRDIPMFNHDGTTAAAFTAYQSVWNETSRPWIHPVAGTVAANTGKRAMAVKIGAALTALPA